jgi:trehalose synthase
MYEVKVTARPIDPFRELVGNERIESIKRRVETLRPTLGPRAIWNINSTATGGGVAEMLRSLVRYSRGLGVDVRWLVVEGPPQFFSITKRIHNALHDSPGDESPLGPEQHAVYDRVMHDNIATLDAVMRPTDIVICHDPQTAGLVPFLLKMGCLVIWRCHIGHDGRGKEVERGWQFLRSYLENVHVGVFSRSAYAPEWLPQARTIVLPPTIDPFSTKNQELSKESTIAILAQVGLIEPPENLDVAASRFTRDDGSVGRVDHEAEVVRAGRPPSSRTPLVVQVSRWDAMKDPIGVLRGFAEIVDPEAPGHAELVLAGPPVRSVSDDPEGAQVFQQVQEAFRALPHAARRRAHLALLPMDDGEENGAIVNALQRHAAVVVQKSLVEGFGLTVTEAMWKGRPVVASAVGGIGDQIRDGVDGLLLPDPNDLREFGAVLRRVLGDNELARRLGRAGRERVGAEYLSISSLERWSDLLMQVLAA